MLKESGLSGQELVSAVQEVEKLVKGKDNPVAEAFRLYILGDTPSLPILRVLPSQIHHNILETQTQMRMSRCFVPRVPIHR